MFVGRCCGIIACPLPSLAVRKAPSFTALGCAVSNGLVFAGLCAARNFSHPLNAFDDARFSSTLHHQLHPQLSQPSVPSGPSITRKATKKFRKLQKSPAAIADNRLASSPTVACSPTVLPHRNLTFRKCKQAARPLVCSPAKSRRLCYPAHRPQLVRSAR